MLLHFELLTVCSEVLKKTQYNYMLITDKDSTSEKKPFPRQHCRAHHKIFKIYHISPTKMHISTVI